MVRQVGFVFNLAWVNRPQNQEDFSLAYFAGAVAQMLAYRIPNIFGKWCRPNYNSAVVTFCNAVANDPPVWNITFLRLTGLIRTKKQCGIQSKKPEINA